MWSPSLQQEDIHCKSQVLKPRTLGASYVAFICALLAICFQRTAAAQDYMQQIGRPTFTSVEPVELGFVDAGNGNLHLEIPLGSFPQRGTRPLTYKLVYDSRIWTNNGNGSVWTPNSWATAQGGWRFVSSADTGGPVGFSSWSQTCGTGGPPTGGESGNNNFYWTAPDGTKRYFPAATTSSSGGSCGTSTTSTASGYAQDSSGYLISIANYSQVTSVLAPDGTQVYPTYEDNNGNKYSKDANGNIIDTLNRTPVLVTNPCATNQICYDILNSQGTTRSRVTITTQSIPVQTAFGQPYTTEYSGSLTVIQSIALPDGTSYQFSYDSGHYGEVTGITLPTGGSISYGYTVNQDALTNYNHWISQRTSGGGTWTYSLNNVNFSAKTQNVTVTKPSGDSKTYSFTLNNGAWRNSVSYSSGMSITETWDTTNPCTFPCSGGGSIYIRKQTENVFMPAPRGGVVKQSQFTYNGLYNLLPSTIKEWNYYPNSQAPPTNPTRITNVTYLSDNNSTYTNANILNRPTSIVVTDGSGTKLKETDYGYDATMISPKTSIIQHDDSKYGTSYAVRGNRTSISQWTTGTNSITTATLYYDMTGQMVEATDANSHNTFFDYTDCYLTGNPPATYSPSQATNAYLTTTTLPASGTLKACYYYYTGKTGWTKDQNNAQTWHYHVNSSGNNDPFDRETQEAFPIGWMLNNYTSQTQLDTYLGIQDATASTSCTSCRHDETLRDTLGRPTDQYLVSDPDGQTRVHTDYDTSSRVLDTSHPYRTTGDSTYGFETVAYDGQDRPKQVTHQDGNISKTYYGANAAGPGGIVKQQCSGCNPGYPTTTQDEAGKIRQVWTDAFGKTVEVDEPPKTASAGGSDGSATVTINGTEQSYTTNPCQNNVYPAPTYCPYTVYNSGGVSVTVNGSTKSAPYGQYDTPSTVANGLANAFNSDPNSTFGAYVSGNVITFTAQSNYSLSVPAATWNTQFFSSASFGATPSGSALTGASNPQLASPTVTYYLYDALSRLQQVTVAGSSECNRTYTYDNLSRLTSSTEPEPGNGAGTCPLNSSHTTNYYYTTTGGAACSGDPTKVCRRTDGRGTTITYTYDPLNRPTGMTYSDSTPTVTYSYDQTTYNGLTIANGAGRRTGMSDGSGMTAWSYDLNGNIVTEKRTIAGITKTISYAYNKDNSLKQLTYPSGRVVNFTVSNAQRTTAAVDSTGTQYAIAPSSGAMYSPPGGLASAVYGKGGTFNGLTESRSYNNRLQITGISASSSAGTALNLAHSYTATGHTNNNGEIMSITNNVDTGRTQNFTYDDLSRISTANSQATSGADCWGQSFTIDAVANLTGMTVTQCSANALSASANGNNQFSSGYTYDAAGNLTGDGTYTYTYNAENEITSANGVTYTYDGNRMRVKKSSGTLYWRDVTGNVIAETDLSGNNVNEYVFFAGRRSVRRKSTGDTYYYQADQVGSVRAITGSTGTVCYDTDYSPYGQEISHTNTCAQNYKFTGYERDSETGLDYAMNRYYNSRIGRFMSPDPLGLAGANFNAPQSMNRYAYVQNNPLSFADPSGLYCVWDDGSYDDDFSDGGAGVGTCASQGGTWFDGSSPGADYDPNKTLGDETQVAEGLGLSSLSQIQQTNIATLLTSGNVSQIIDFVKSGTYGVDMLSRPWNQYSPPSVLDALKNWLFPGKQKFCADNHFNMEFDAVTAGAIGWKYPEASAPFGISAAVEWGINVTACR